MNTRKIGVLYRKDMRDFVKNPGISVAGLVPIMFVLLYKFMGLADMMDAEGASGSLFLLHLGTAMSLSMVALLIISTTIAEEKEKFTLRTLMLSNVSAMEFLLSKILVTLTVVLVSDAVIFLLSGSPAASLLFYLLCCILGSGSLIMLSACIGIVCRDQMSTSIYQIPVMLLVLLPTMFENWNSFIGAIARVTPVSALMKLYLNFTYGSLFCMESLTALIVMLVWIAGASALFAYLYRKKGMDN